VCTSSRGDGRKYYNYVRAKILYTINVTLYIFFTQYTRRTVFPIMLLYYTSFICTLLLVLVYTYFVLLYLLFECDGALLVFAPLILKPHTYDPRTKSGHLDQLLLHEGVRPRVGRVARPQRVQLLLVEHRSDAGRFAVRRAFARRSQPAVARTVRSGPARTLVRTRF